MRAERITDVIAYHMEGPCWWPAWGGLRCVDMLDGEVVSIDMSGRSSRQKVDRVAACVRPRERGGMIVAVERGFALVDPDGTLTRLPSVWEDPALRMNEGACAPDGSMYAGQMAYDKTKGAAAMFRITPERKVTRVFDGLTISNGLDWSPDGSLAYYVDTDTSRVDVFDWSAEGGLTGRRPFVEIPDGGRPDGLVVDAEGGVWVAVANGGRVEHYTVSGELAEVVEVGARKVTACTFGGEGLDRLFITTSREGVPEGEDPQAGSLFVVEPGVVGKLPGVFAG
ncbi:Sugar lactone lactonase YvrE [Austwickia chelonae]|uniref:Putative gluconolactonase n=1 Tax=Austwickia chelonae NBRC 105200 TaxID=1184607 RepID=K6V8N5_9MICO|nr:SMP-30/gluconolactonase/LRE family protein [Austwickia chelonae]GAB78573.1 putative gluconolactonase [Austwickia chelonae NBRC 105200]SEW40934.1 Sugar lactone lactonase YvrE [Austwickia chelonae]